MREWRIFGHFLSKSVYKSNNQDNKHSREHTKEHVKYIQWTGQSCGRMMVLPQNLLMLGVLPAPLHQRLEVAEHPRSSVQPWEFANMNHEQFKSGLVLSEQSMLIDTSCMQKRYPKMRYVLLCFISLEQFINTDRHINFRDRFMPNSDDCSWVPPGPIKVRYYL